MGKIALSSSVIRLDFLLCFKKVVNYFAKILLTMMVNSQRDFYNFCRDISIKT